MQWRTPKPGRAIDRKAPLWPVAAVMSAVLAGVGVVVAQQFIAGPVFRAAVCLAPRNDSDTRIADGIIIASVVAVAAVGATRTKLGLAVMPCCSRSELLSRLARSSSSADRTFQDRWSCSSRAAGSHGSHIHGIDRLPGGPRSCWYRGVEIESRFPGSPLDGVRRLRCPVRTLRNDICGCAVSRGLNYRRCGLPRRIAGVTLRQTAGSQASTARRRPTRHRSGASPS